MSQRSQVKDSQREGGGARQGIDWLHAKKKVGGVPTCLDVVVYECMRSLHARSNHDTCAALRDVHTERDRHTSILLWRFGICR